MTSKKTSTYRYRSQITRLKLTPEQEAIANQNVDFARFIWNMGLSEWNYMYQLSVDKADKQLKPTGNKLRDKFVQTVKPVNPWIRTYSKDIHNTVFATLETAWKRYFNNPSYFGKPNFKSKHRSKRSFSFTESVMYFKDNYHIKLPKMGVVKMWDKHRFRNKSSKIIRATVSEIGGQWFLSITYRIKDKSSNEFKRSKHLRDKVGVDMNVHDFVTSDKMFFPTVDSSSYDKKIKRRQRKLSKLTKGSNRYLVAKNKLQRAYASKSKAIRYNAHLISKFLVTHYKQINIEDIKASNMMKNHNLARRIGDSAFRVLRDYIVYKAKFLKERGVDIVVNEVSARYTTQTCSHCGTILEHKLKLGQQTFKCEACGYVNYRDINASINIRNKIVKQQLV